ncbi:MAG: phosphonate C-P lyase system protein PhnH [Actinomycetota bacterium]
MTVSPGRLTAASSFSVFTTLLGALARPGRAFPLPRDGAATAPPALVPALALADETTRVAVLADSPVWGEVVHSLTGASVSTISDNDIHDQAAVDLRRVDLVIALCAITPGVVELMAPAARSVLAARARVVLAVEDTAAPPAKSGADDTVTVTVRGPGASEGRRVAVRGLDRDVVAAIDQVNSAGNGGLDLWLASSSGTVIGVPRTCRIESEDRRSLGRRSRV